MCPDVKPIETASQTAFGHKGLWEHIFIGIDAMARQRLVSLIFIFVLSFTGNILWAKWHGDPVPFVIDEFSHLLAGDTFAHLRVTNPPHPYPEFFDALDVLQRPTYMSIYPPGQGISLAIGQAVFGKPIYGIWLSAGLMCAAICWMLYAWLPPRWALVGGLVSVMQFGVFTYWSQSYWGGPVSAIGGALVFGALGRLINNSRARDSFWLGLGFTMLLISRPVEGFLLAIPVGLLVLPWEFKPRNIQAGALMKKIILPMGLVLLVTASAMGQYNKQITGDANVFPYLLYYQKYSTFPCFIWQPLNTKVTHSHKALVLSDKKVNVDYYLDKKNWRVMLHDFSDEGLRIFMFFLGFPLAIPAVFKLFDFFIDRKLAIRFSLAFLLLLCPFFFLGSDILPHYFSPMASLAVLLITSGLKHLSGLKKNDQHRGHRLIVYVFVMQLIMNIAFTPTVPSVRSLGQAVESPHINLPLMFTRDELRDILLKRKGKYLVFMNYSRDNYWVLWVHNDADIDHAPIVWAWDMGEHNKVLIDYFKDRQVLKVNVVWTRPGFWQYYARQ